MTKNKDCDIIEFCEFLVELARKIEMCPEPLIEHCIDVQGLIAEKNFYKKQYEKLIRDSKNNEGEIKNAQDLLKQNPTPLKNKGFWLV